MIKGGGLRDFFLYRDLGIADATGGQVICHLVKDNSVMPPATDKVPSVTPGGSGMSSPEELTFVIGRWLRPIAVVLDVARRIRVVPISSREQASTEPHR